MRLVTIREILLAIVTSRCRLERKGSERRCTFVDFHIKPQGCASPRRVEIRDCCQHLA